MTISPSNVPVLAVIKQAQLSTRPNGNATRTTAALEGVSISAEKRVQLPPGPLTHGRRFGHETKNVAGPVVAVEHAAELLSHPAMRKSNRVPSNSSHSPASCSCGVTGWDYLYEPLAFQTCVVRFTVV